MTTKSEREAYAAVAQDFCCLPWCGKTGKIDLHHIKRRSQGGQTTVENLLPVCHECHMKHHDGMLPFEVTSQDMIGGAREVYVRRSDGPITGHEGWCVFADPNRDAPSPEVMDEQDGEALYSLGETALVYAEDGNAASWKLSQTVRSVWDVFRERYSDREATKRTIEWGEELTDTYGNLRPLAPSTTRKLLRTASLPATEEVVALSLAERDRLRRAMEHGAEYDDAASDIYALSRDDFDATYLGKRKAVERVRHECPICHSVHADKRVPFDEGEV